MHKLSVVKAFPNTYAESWPKLLDYLLLCNRCSGIGAAEDFLENVSNITARHDTDTHVLNLA